MDTKKKKKYNENLRLVVMNENTFEEKYSFNLNLRNLYVLISAIIVALFILMFLFISYTPMRHLVPGYGDIENNSYVIKLNQYVNDLEEKINIQDQYNQSLKKIILEHDTSLIVNNKSTSAKSIIKNINKENSKSTFANPNFSSPIDGEINKKIDVKSGHYGIDIAGNKNAPIKSIADGIVVFSDWSTETGNTIIIQHSNGILSVYKHNSSLFKEIGDFVKKNEAIGTIGNTGTLTDGPHLHFELWYKGTPLNPLDYISL